ncbi:hypothetical protein B0H14DRAFT_3640726, partial [Mycena olivaceomarginata]
LRRHPQILHWQCTRSQQFGARFSQLQAHEATPPRLCRPPSTRAPQWLAPSHAATLSEYAGTPRTSFGVSPPISNDFIGHRVRSSAARSFSIRRLRSPLHSTHSILFRSITTPTPLLQRLRLHCGPSADSSRRRLPLLVDTASRIQIGVGPRYLHFSCPFPQLSSYVILLIHPPHISPSATSAGLPASHLLCYPSRIHRSSLPPRFPVFAFPLCLHPASRCLEFLGRPGDFLFWKT